MEMETNQENTYEPLEGRRRIESTDSPDVDATPPRDRNGILYVALLAAGIGFVLPYNSFIIASDYWQERFPGRSVALDMSMTYIIVAFATVLLNNVFLSLFSFKVRIIFGYAISLSTLVFVALCEVAWHMFTAQTAYAVNLVAVSLTAVGCTVQQSSFYGFASMFPKKYTQAVMAGESFAGLLVASTRISIKLVISSDELSTVIFFLTSTTYIALSYVLHSTTVHSPFVRYHMRACSKIVLRPDEDRVLSDMVDDSSASKYGILSITPPATRHNQNHKPHHSRTPADSTTTATAPTTGLSFCNPVYELSNPSAGESTLDWRDWRCKENGDSTKERKDNKEKNLSEDVISARPSTPPPALPNVAFKVEHILAPSCVAGNQRFGNFRAGLESRWRVAHAIYPYMVCIALAYCVTLSLYPGIESEIVSCNLKSWMPVLLMFTFNTSDVMGKVMASIPYPWSRRQLILLSTMRIALVPLLLLCCAPRAQPIIAGETPPFIFSAALGITNGLAGSLPMMLAPAKVPATLKEVTGNMMTLSYNVGLTAGSLIGYVFDSMLGPQQLNPCPKYPYIPKYPYLFNTTTAATILPRIKLILTTPSTTPSTLEATTSTSALATIATTAAATLLSNFVGNSSLSNNLPTTTVSSASHFVAKLAKVTTTLAVAATTTTIANSTALGLSTN